MKPTEHQVKAFTTMARQFPEFAEFLDAWRQEELEAIPYGKDSLDVKRGRVQTLTELQRHLSLRS